MTPVLIGLLVHFALISMLAIGGFMASLPGIYTYLVVDTGLLTAEQFASTVAFGQSLPGPNVQIASVLGWAAAGPWGAAAAMTGTAIPFTIFALVVGRYMRAHAGSDWVKAYKKGMAPIAVGLLFATGALLLHGVEGNLLAMCWAAMITLLVWKTKIPLFAMIVAGGVFGYFVL